MMSEITGKVNGGTEKGHTETLSSTGTRTNKEKNEREQKTTRDSRNVLKTLSRDQ